MKYTVDELAYVTAPGSEIRGTFDEPLDFSISGMFVVDAPDSLELRASTSSLSTLLAAKVAAFKALYPSLTNDEYDEMLAGSVYDPALSNGALIGLNKRTCMIPGGTLFTGPGTYSAPPTGTNYFLHHHGFFLYRQPADPTDTTPPPHRLLYNYDPGSGFVEFNPSNIRVDICDGAGTPLEILTPNQQTAFSTWSASTYRLKFTNLSSRRIFLSDWIFLMD